MNLEENILEEPIDKAIIARWNWGAFWLTFVWGIRHRTYISLLGLIPILNIFMMFYLGKMGNELAFRNCGWIDSDYFNRSMKRWNIVGWVVAVAIAIGIVLVGKDISYQAALEAQYKVEVKELILADETVVERFGKEFEIVDYVVSNRLNLRDVTRRLNFDSEAGEFYVIIRTDDNDNIYELLLWFLEDGYLKERIIEK